MDLQINSNMQDKDFAELFTAFVNGQMNSADVTGKEMARAHRYLQNEMFKVCIAFIKYLAHNYKNGYYDDRNEWACRLSETACRELVEQNMLYDVEFEENNSKHNTLCADY